MLFLAIRERARWSQQTFGGIVDLDQSQISAIERGERHLRDVVIVSRLARIFGIPRPCSISEHRRYAYVSEAGGNGQGGRGSAYYELARISGDQRAAGRAVLLLSEAVGNYDPGYAQFQARYLPDLAGARTLTGDIDTAVTLGHQAVDLLSAQYSSRVHERLRILNTVLAPLHTSTGVAELRGRLAAIAA